VSVSLSVLCTFRHMLTRASRHCWSDSHRSRVNLS